MAPRLVRRRPLAERLKAYLNPIEFLFWLSEELDSGDWDQWQKEWATPMGILVNVVFLIARANTGYSTRGGADDVFGEDARYTGWLAWLVRRNSGLLRHQLSLTCGDCRHPLSFISSLSCHSSMLFIPFTASDITGFSRARSMQYQARHLLIGSA